MYNKDSLSDRLEGFEFLYPQEKFSFPLNFMEHIFGETA